MLVVVLHDVPDGYLSVGEIVSFSFVVAECFGGGGQGEKNNWGLGEALVDIGREK